MKRTRFSEEQIVYALKLAESGTSVANVCRKYGISDATFYTWRKKYGGLGVSELRRLRELDAENKKLKQLVADLTLDKHMLQGGASKKTIKPAGRRALVTFLMEAFQISERHGCRLLQCQRSTQRYRSRRQDDRGLALRLKELALARPRFGYRRLHVLLQREGWAVNHKRIYRLYCEAELWVRIKRRRKRAAAIRGPAPVPSAPGQCWSMDFVTDRLLDGRAFQALTVVYNLSRQSPLIEVAHSMTSRHVIVALERAARQMGLPLTITCDNGSQFTSRLLDTWAYENDVRLDFIRPGKPVENAYIESFNGRFRDECLNSHEFESLEGCTQEDRSLADRL